MKDRSFSLYLTGLMLTAGGIGHLTQQPGYAILTLGVGLMTAAAIITLLKVDGLLR